MSLRGFLKAAELVIIGRPHPALRMSAARTIFRARCTALDMERLHGAAFRNTPRDVREISESARHVLRRSRDHGRKEARHAGRIHAADRMRDLFRRGIRSVVIHARESVHLDIDKARRDVDALLRRSQQVIDSIDHSVEGNLDVFPRDDINAVTFHDTTGLCTSFPQQVRAK